MNHGLLFLFVCLCGGLGATCRFILDTAIKKAWSRSFPLSTTIINLFASLLLGLIMGLLAGPEAGQTSSSPSAGLVVFKTVSASGFLGGFSTFSTAINESRELLQKGKKETGAASLAVSMICPALCAWVGYAMGMVLRL